MINKNAGTRSFTVGDGRKGVASHTLMTIVAWGYAALGFTTKWWRSNDRRRFYFLGILVFVASLYAWMGYITARHYHFWDEIVAACVVGTSVLLVYVYILDAIDRNRRSITMVGSSVKSTSKDRILQDSYTALWWILSFGVMFCVLFVLIKRIWVSSSLSCLSPRNVLTQTNAPKIKVPSFRLGSGFWLFLPTDLNFLCLLFGSLILYLQHGYIPGALFAEIWVAGSMLCYVIFETTLRISGISDFIFYLLTLLGAPLVSNETMRTLKLEMNAWDEGDSFALWTFYALGVCCVQAHEIPKYMFMKRRRWSAGLSCSSSSNSTSSSSSRHYLHILLHLSMFLTYVQLLASMYRVANATWQVDEDGHLVVVPAAGASTYQSNNVSLKGFKLAFVLVPVCTSCVIAMLTQPHVRHAFDMFAELISKPPDVVTRAPRRSRNLTRVLKSVVHFLKDEDSVKIRSLGLSQYLSPCLFLFGLLTNRPLLSGISVPLFLFLREIYITKTGQQKDLPKKKKKTK